MRDAGGGVPYTVYLHHQTRYIGGVSIAIPTSKREEWEWVGVEVARAGQGLSRPEWDIGGLRGCCGGVTGVGVEVARAEGLSWPGWDAGGLTGCCGRGVTGVDWGAKGDAGVVGRENEDVGGEESLWIESSIWCSSSLNGTIHTSYTYMY